MSKFTEGQAQHLKPKQERRFPIGSKEEQSELLSEMMKADEDAGLYQDSILESVVKQFRDRSEVGIKKYGVTLDREDLSLLDWLEHAKQEGMDKVLYLEKAIQMLKKEQFFCNDEAVQKAQDLGEPIERCSEFCGKETCVE